MEEQLLDMEKRISVLERLCDEQQREIACLKAILKINDSATDPKEADSEDDFSWFSVTSW